MNSNAKWIWKDYYSDKTRLILFRKDLFINEHIETYLINISADSRYKLYVNNTLLCTGPCRNGIVYKYYEEVDIGSYLKTGRNMIAVEVVHYSGDIHDSNIFDGGPVSVISTMRGGLIVIDKTENGYLNSNSSWKHYDCKEHKFVKSRLTSYVGYNDEIDGSKYPFGWKTINFDDSNWDNSKEILNNNNYFGGGLLSPWALKKRVIPLPYLNKIYFKRVMRHSKNINNAQDILVNKTIRINENSHAWFEIDIGEYINAELRFKVFGGSGGKIDLIYGESYGEYEANGEFVKKIRDDCSLNKFLNGDTHTFYCGKSMQEYTPFGYKTFRFLRIDIFTKDQEFELNGIDVYETGYPLEVKGSFISNDEIYNDLWNVSLRTIKCCMYETFMDCPYYEQMQYIMDTMLQASYIYRITDDYRLIRKAIDDFSNSQLYDGILPCNAPSKFIQIIPGFMFYFVYMLYDYYNYTGDIEFVKKHIPTVEKIFNYFKGYMKKNNLIDNTGFWQYVDWVNEWDRGCPVKAEDELNIIYNMMMVKALNETEIMLNKMHRNDNAKEYKNLSVKISKAINKLAWDEEKQLYYTTTDKVAVKSQHAQVWAVLSGVANSERAISIMKSVIEDESLLQCSYSMSYFLFRALEKTGLYSYTAKLWDKWANLLKLNLTTWPEDPVSQRSDCHAWSSIPLYEFSACYIGIKPLEPGFEKVLIKPMGLWLTECKCDITTPKGIIKAQYKVFDGKINMVINLPMVIETIIEMPNGERFIFNTMDIEFEQKLDT